MAGKGALAGSEPAAPKPELLNDVSQGPARGGYLKNLGTGAAMRRMLDLYKDFACRSRHERGDDHRAAWAEVHDCWAAGRLQFAEAFAREVGKPPLNAAPDDLLRAAVPKSLGDMLRKDCDDAYYAAHAALFIIEMDEITSRVPREDPDPGAVHAFGNVLRFVDDVLFDSVVLLEHWAERSLGVPGVFGVGKNEVEHMHTFLFGARQTIYGHGSFGLSFAGNHSDLAIATIRQAVEIRLRRGFGVVGLIRSETDPVEPVPLSAIFEAIQPLRDRIELAVPFDLIVRIYGWANMHVHAAIKLPAWTAPRVLERLQPLLIGTGRRKGDGIAMSSETLEAVRVNLRNRYDHTDRPVGFLLEPACDAFIRP